MNWSGLPESVNYDSLPDLATVIGHHELQLPLRNERPVKQRESYNLSVDLNRNRPQDFGIPKVFTSVRPEGAARIRGFQKYPLGPNSPVRRVE